MTATFDVFFWTCQGRRTERGKRAGVIHFLSLKQSASFTNTPFHPFFFHRHSSSGPLSTPVFRCCVLFVTLPVAFALVSISHHQNSIKNGWRNHRHQEARVRNLQIFQLLLVLFARVSKICGSAWVGPCIPGRITGRSCVFRALQADNKNVALGLGLRRTRERGLNLAAATFAVLSAMKCHCLDQRMVDDAC